ncbi:hypothetical protein ZHAS_00015421 [Anopheles sinensis]|uniref:Uncharacterized protein n=1 Tax=Anopheles sinensis TaxID=74873 RepID=A0A084WB77_ANOSI|nr:hypothetical protein ZHAS_00015421 [Anopheles sinensis]
MLSDGFHHHPAVPMHHQHPHLAAAVASTSPNVHPFSGTSTSSVIKENVLASVVPTSTSAGGSDSCSSPSSSSPPPPPVLQVQKVSAGSPVVSSTPSSSSSGSTAVISYSHHPSHHTTGASPASPSVYTNHPKILNSMKSISADVAAADLRKGSGSTPADRDTAMVVDEDHHPVQLVYRSHHAYQQNHHQQHLQHHQQHHHHHPNHHHHPVVVMVPKQESASSTTSMAPSTPTPPVIMDNSVASSSGHHGGGGSTSSSPGPKGEPDLNIGGNCVLSPFTPSSLASTVWEIDLLCTFALTLRRTHMHIAPRAPFGFFRAQKNGTLSGRGFSTQKRNGKGAAKRFSFYFYFDEFIPGPLF